MTAGPTPQFSRRTPLLVALGALVFYGATLSHGVTIHSLPLTAQIAGWDWLPLTGRPLLWLLTLPCRLLPAAGVACGLNLISAATAALTLGVLARTVQLLPWDPPFAEGRRLAGLLPVGLACAACGLEFSFWREATAASGEMLDLLLLATALWLLLEYRLRRKKRWLEAAALVWGLGMAENWAMLLTLPLFVAGVVWLHGILRFDRRLLVRLAGLGLAGFSVYALLPLVNGWTPDSPWNLGEAWLVSLRETRNLAVRLPHQIWADRPLLLAVMTYWLVPSLACLVRLRDQGMKHKLSVDRFQIWTYRALRAVLLLACLWLTFDPVNGPRQLVQSRSGLSLAWLTFDYLNALGVAFLAGNFLLIPQLPLRRPSGALAKLPWRRMLVPAACALLVLLSAGLAVRNAPVLLDMNFQPLERFGELVAGFLPDGGGCLISSEPRELQVVQAALAHHNRGSEWRAVDMRTLPLAAYRGWLDHRQHAGWLTDENRRELNEAETARLLTRIAGSSPLICLHPTYGHLCERYYAESTGPVYVMGLRETNRLNAPPPTAAVTAANEAFWNAAWTRALAPLAPPAAARPTFWRKRLQRWGVTPPPADQPLFLAAWYSRSLTAWGVALQQQGRLPEARLRLEQALRLNTNNYSAQISLACNTNLQAGLRPLFAGADRAAAQLGDSRRLSQLLNECGPFDDPVYCYLLGVAFQKIGMPVQAAEQFDRSRILAPDAFTPQLALAEIYQRLHLGDRSSPLLNHLSEETRKLPAGNPLNLEVTLLEAASWLAQTNPAKAGGILDAVLRQHPDDDPIANQVISLYLSYGDFTNPVRLLQARLAKAPDNPTNLVLLADVLILAGQTAACLPVLDHILALTNLPDIRLERALARLTAQEDFAAAEADIQVLEMMGNQAGRAGYGRAMVAEHRHDTNQAARYLRICLTNTPPGAVLWLNARARLQALEPRPGDPR